MQSYHVAIAAEAFAAGIFAQLGCDVLVQYGANQPDYDLAIVNRQGKLNISVKGSQDGGWGLVQSYKKPRNSYIDAINHWLIDHNNIVFCLVQFKDTKVGECPRVYLATAHEIADHMKKLRNGLGDTVLRENYRFVKGVAADTESKIPENWRLSCERLMEVLNAANEPIPVT